LELVPHATHCFCSVCAKSHVSKIPIFELKNRLARPAVTAA
jgi:hypothetical protein